MLRFASTAADRWRRAALRQWLLGSLLTILTLPAWAAWFSDAQDIMGTRVSAELWLDDEAAARQALAAVMTDMRRIEQLMSPWIETSELAQVNQHAAANWVVVSRELFDVIRRAQHYAELSGGAFDITFASVGFLYDYRQGVAPTDEALAATLPAVNYRSIELDDKRNAIRFTRPGVKIDLGGIAKGHAVDSAIAILRKHGVRHAIVSAGGDSRVLGDRWDRPWMVGIRHPRKPRGEYAVMLPLVDTAISTSGDYERFFMRDGERIHHIVTPETGRSARGVQSVSVLAPLALDSDALSTTVFVLGVERGLALIDSLPGIDAVIIDAEGKLHYSQELLLQQQ